MTILQIWRKNYLGALRYADLLYLNMDRSFVGVHLYLFYFLLENVEASLAGIGSNILIFLSGSQEWNWVGTNMPNESNDIQSNSNGNAISLYRKGITNKETMILL